MSTHTLEQSCPYCDMKQSWRVDDATSKVVSSCIYCGFKPDAYITDTNGEEWFGVEVIQRKTTIIFKSAGLRRHT